MPLQPVIQVLARCFSKLCLKAFGEIRMIGKSTIYITSATVNFFCCNNMAAFFMRMDLIYSTGDIPVSCLIFR